ncbi:MAG: acetyl-CoA C-acetyltransferase [Alphaproteobacteria bacterium]
MREVVIVSAARTAVGSFCGTLSKTPAHILGKTVICETIKRAGINASDISSVIMGQVLTAACGQNPARQAAIASNIPETTPAYTVNQVCGSGLRSIINAAMSIQTGCNDVIIAGGQENMSLAPHTFYLRSGIKMGNYETTDTMLKDGLMDAMLGYHMGVTAENIAKKYNISREEQDSFAALSQQKASKSRDSGIFKDEIVPITIKDKKQEIIFAEDEFIRPDTTKEVLAKLRPAFDASGTVTAGNASGVNDGAAAILLMSLEEAKKKGLKPLAKIASFADAGVDPAFMGIGPVFASRKALDLAGWKPSDLDLIEANEAFAAQSIAVNKEMNWDLDIVNVNGGAIALGHPIGASGTRILVSLLYEMQKRDAKKGLATLCIGGGMGIALCVER